ncbi:MAG: peptidylprolyl isomerase [Chloroflexi bacterium]|nr:peptidylprolyl isomerase [Chloroflexota bacterium]
MSSNPPPPSGTRRVRSAHESRSATVRAAAAAPSRRQRSHWQREQHQLKLLYAAVAALAIVVALIFAVGIIYDNVVQANQVVAQVGPDSITAGQLLDEVRPQAHAIDAQASQMGDPSTTADYVDQQKRSLPNSVLNDLVDAHVIAQEAARRGISVSPAELDDKERETVASFNAATNPAPTPAATPPADATAVSGAAGASPASDATAAALPGAAATTTTTTSDAAAASAANAVGTPVADATAISAVTGADATPAAASDQSATPAAATTPTPVPTLEDSAYGPALQQLLDKNNLTEPELRTILERGLLQDKVSAAIGEEQVPAVQPQVHARQILVTTQDQANDLLSQLQNGADFATLAQQNSTDTATKASGGDMGWFGKGVQTKAIDDAVFALQPGQLSGVVGDTAGFHILQVLETDPNRAVPPDQLTTLRQKAFNDWLNTQRSSQDVKLSLNQAQTNWILSKIGVRP